MKKIKKYKFFLKNKLNLYIMSMEGGGMNMNNFPKITIKAARMNCGKTQKEVAKELGISETTYIRWEKEPSNISAKYQKKLEKIFNFPTDLIIFLP